MGKKRRMTFAEFSADPRYIAMREHVIREVYRVTADRLNRADTPEKYLAVLEEQTGLIEKFWESVTGIPPELKAKIAEITRAARRTAMDIKFPGFLQ